MPTFRNTIILIFMLASMAFNASALPKTKATQVTVDPSGISSSTNTTVQEVLEDFDDNLAVPATTSTPGVVRFATPEEVTAGTETNAVVTPANMALSFGLVEFLHVQDQKPSGTDGGTFTSGAWQTRDIQTVEVNTISGATNSANQIALPAGTYYLEGSSISYKTFSNKLRWRNITDSTDALIGFSAQTQSGDENSIIALVSGRFTIATAKTFELQHRCSSTTTSTGLGYACGFGVVEIYSDIKIWKLN